MADQEDIKRRILEILGGDGRASMQRISEQLGVPRSTVHALYRKAIDDYGLVFTAELNIDQLYKFEIMNRARGKNKRQLVREIIDDASIHGHMEYIVLFNFSKQKPTEKEIADVSEYSDMPQYIGILDDGIVMYCVVKQYDELEAFVSRFCKAFDSSEIIPHLYRVNRLFGFFPLRSRFIEGLKIFPTYKDLLLGICERGRDPFRLVSDTISPTSGFVGRAYQNLKDNKVLDKMTYYETKPQDNVNIFVRIRPTSYVGMIDPNWFRHSTERNGNRNRNPFTFVCNSTGSNEILVFASLESTDSITQFVGSINEMIPEADIEYRVVTGSALGSLGRREISIISI